MNMIHDKKRTVIEICCGSYHDALEAYRGGVNRIELNSALVVGRLTPTTVMLKLNVRNFWKPEQTELPLVA